MVVAFMTGREKESHGKCNNSLQLYPNNAAVRMHFIPSCSTDLTPHLPLHVSCTHPTLSDLRQLFIASAQRVLMNQLSISHSPAAAPW